LIKIDLFLAITLVFLITVFACEQANEDSTIIEEKDPQSLVIVVHDSFDISKSLIDKFEEENNATITIVKGGDAGEVLNRAILERGNPSADLLYGIDNTYLSKALREDLFIAYKSPLLVNVPNHLVLDKTFHVTPIDFGYVNINYDKQYLIDNALDPPVLLEELTDSKWENRMVVENPATSSPGLAFLIATISYFGEDDEYDYLDFWEDLRNNGVVVKDGWSDAYYNDFSLNGGDRPLVVSYATSPAAEVYFSEGKYTEPPTGNLIIDKATFQQIEGIGILKGTEVEKLASSFIDFALDVSFQEDIPSKMFVYPVNRRAAWPDFFQFAQVPKVHSDISHEDIDEKREDWIEAWVKVVLR